MDPFKYKRARDLDVHITNRASNIQREADHIDALLHPLIGAMLHPWMTLMHRMQITGQEYLPAKPPYIMIANHTSHLDTPALLSSLPSRIRRRACPLAAYDTFFTTRARALISTKLINLLPLHRHQAGRHALATLRERVIEDELVLIVYPEGTRGGGEAIAKFRAGIGMLVAKTRVPVVPCRLRGCERAMPKGRWLPRPMPLRLTIGEPLLFVDTLDNREGWQLIAHQLYAAVNAL